MASLRSDFSLGAVVAGFVAVLVGYTSSVALVFQAAQAVGATPAHTASWLWALGLGMGATSIALSWRYRQPVLTAWSTPGAALIAASSGIGMAEAVGAFMLCGALLWLAGATRAFERVMDRIPQALAAALLAGVLARFALDAAVAARGASLLLVAMALVFVAGRRWWPRYAVPGVLVAGIAVALLQGQVRVPQVESAWAWPLWTTPAFSLHAAVGLALPLFVVTMASQNLPGVAAQRASGYDTPVSAPVAATGAATLLLAPFGGYALNLAAITAAICMGREAHEDPSRRYVAAMMAGAFYIALGCAGGAVVALLAAFPRELVLGVAGLALLSTIGGALLQAMKEDSARDAAMLTFIVTLSGLQFAGIGSAFWGVVAGAAAMAVQHWRARSSRALS
jgi:benzoate membrane transport protein